MRLYRSALGAAGFAQVAFLANSALLPQASVASTCGALGPPVFTVSGAFPTSIYTQYYNDPTATSAQPQPVITDPITRKVYPYDLSNPDTVPLSNTHDPQVIFPKASSEELLDAAFSQVLSVASNPTFGSNSCARCQAALQAGKFLAMAAPEQGPALVVQLCEHFGYKKDCTTEYGISGVGQIITQAIAHADVGGLDGQMICARFFAGLCPAATASPLDLSEWFAKPKPNPLPPPRKASGKRMKILHLSDLHIDPRYANGAEATCTTRPCCRAGNVNAKSPNETIFPAPRYGTFTCDPPLSLIVSALEAIPVLTGTEKAGFDFTLYTGDLVGHDGEHQMSRDFVTYSETLVFDLLKRMLGTGPVYAALGNHDSYHKSQHPPNSLSGELSAQFDWHYKHLAALWEYQGWLDHSAADLARKHNAAYMVRREDGLRIITLNTDFWYIANYFNYINMTDPDLSGMLRFLTDELQDAEDAGDAAWIVGHVPAGWDGTHALPNPSNLFYQIVDRFSPHVLKAMFFGHTHQDQLMLYYANNATEISASAANAAAWIGPSITPMTNLNSGFRMYEVDSGSFEVLDAYTWISDVSSYPALDAQTDFGPAFEFEYSTRDAYGAGVPDWGPDDPLNATWWHRVTEAMEKDSSLTTDFVKYQGKSSILTPSCTGECLGARICYIRSGSVPVARQNCYPGRTSGG
ncbi:sphingomyelin phosphodiesterase [Cubamyces sp. BRFM 1775]|nr:sphingomyelin phosphodiesterase [Cubamyces sp. BRFM 1775]